MNELDRLKAKHAELQRKYDQLLNTHLMHLLVAQELSNRVTRGERALH